MRLIVSVHSLVDMSFVSNALICRSRLATAPTAESLSHSILNYTWTCPPELLLLLLRLSLLLKSQGTRSE